MFCCHGVNIHVGAAWRTGGMLGLSQFLQIVRPSIIPRMQISWMKDFHVHSNREWNMVSKGD